MDNPIVSVIIPTYNRSQMVVEAVESALAQTYRPLEIIVVDDGSKDDTAQRLAAFGDKIVYLRQENQGVAAARNTGIRRATGEFVAFLDSDDLWHREKIEIQVGYMKANPEVGMVASRMVPQKRSQGRCTEPLAFNAATIPCVAVPLQLSVIGARYATSAVMIKRSCLTDIGFFDVTLPPAEDREMWIRISSRYSVRLLQQPLAFDRVEMHEHLSGKPGKTEDSSRRMIEKIFRELPQLQGKKLLKRRALSVVSHEAGISYTASGDHVTAIRRTLHSLVLWPLPNKLKVDSRFSSLMVMGMRLMRLRKN